MMNKTKTVTTTGLTVRSRSKLAFLWPLALNIAAGTAAGLLLQWALAAFIQLHLPEPTSRNLLWGLLSDVVGLALIYAAYRFAFWSLASARYKAQTQAILTPVMMLVQPVFGGLLASGILAVAGQQLPFFLPAQDPEDPFFTSVSDVVFMAIFVLANLAAFGAITYFFARRRANRTAEVFQPSEAAAPHVPAKLRPFMLVYGVMASLLGFYTVLDSVKDLFTHHNYTGLINIVAWSVFLFLFWNAYRQRVIGQRTLWRLLAPALLVADVIGTAVVGGNDMFGIIGSFILSLPLYMAVLWYAYRFLPASRDREIHHIKREDLFQ